MFIISIIALIGVCITLALLIVEKKTNKKNVEELNKIIDSNNKEINTSLSSGLLEAKQKVDEKDIELRNTLDEKYKKLDNAIAEVKELSLTYKEHCEEYSDTAKEELGEKIASLSKELIQTKDDILEYTYNELKSSRNDYSDKIATLAEALQKVLDDNKDLKKKLEFYTEIDADSGKINVQTDAAVEDDLISKALAELGRQDLKIPETQTPTSKSNESIAESEHDANIDIDVNTSVTDVSKKDKSVQREETDTKSTVLDEEQLEAFYAMTDTTDNMFITGKAGTGKSFLLNMFQRATTKKTIKLAPTGIAALNIGGVTIHSAFGYYNLEQLDVDDISPISLRLKSEKQMTLREAETIIIDEISMVRADTFDKIDRILQVVSKNNRPFGGKQMIVLGDLFQLPPIAKKQEQAYLKNRYGGVFFFNSIAYRSGNFRFMELSVNHRQEQDAQFFEMLNRIREGKVLAEDIDKMNTRFLSDKSEYRRLMTLFPKKADAEKVNQAELRKLMGKEHEFTATVIYNKYPDQTRNLEAIFPISDKLKLKTGAFVMMTANDPEKRWVNGNIGIVRSLRDDIVIVSINEVPYEIKPVVFTEQEATVVNGKIEYEDILSVEQYPIVLAYAITIHKSQGMTYQEIACDISTCFAPGQAYVALSRCASLKGLHLLTKMSGDVIKPDQDVLDFYNAQKSLFGIRSN